MEHPIFQEYRAKEEELHRVKAELKALNDQIQEIRKTCQHDFETKMVENWQQLQSVGNQRLTVLSCKNCGALLKR